MVFYSIRRGLLGYYPTNMGAENKGYGVAAV
jgi:hypothetical protein